MTDPHPIRLNGVRQIVAFNWPKFVLAAVLVALLVLAMYVFSLPTFVDAVLVLAVATTVWFAVASVFASWWIYDHSDLYDWDWLVGSHPPTDSWLNIHTGFDETTNAWRSRFRSDGNVVDLFDPPVVGEHSIERARARVAPDPASVTGSPSDLPFADHSFAVVLVVFAAHEIASAEDRDALFVEVARVLAPGGTVLVVEHMRDLANFAVFGPGAMHFYSLRSWRHHMSQAGLTIDDEQNKTPFVRSFRATKAS